MSTQGTGPDLEARLRAADPAASTEPDLRALRAAVDARIGAHDEGSEGSGAAPAHELAHARERRRFGWPARVASAAAAALVLGAGGGYAVGATGQDDGGSLPVLTLEQPAGSMGAGPMGTTGDMGGSAMPSDAPRAEAAGDSIGYWGHSGRTLFEHSGLSTERASGRVWGFDTAVWSAQTLRAAAAALGVTGEPERQGTVWRSGVQDGTGPAAELYGDGTATFGFWDPTKDVWRCQAVAEPMPAPDEGVAGDAGEAREGTVEIMPVEPEPCTEQDLGPAPGDDAAIATVRDVLRAIGVDVDAHEFAVEGEATGPYRYVTAHLVVDGRRTGASWSASLTGAGLTSLHGQLAPLVDLGEYEVVSPVEAVERLMDPRFGSSGPVGWLDGREPAWVETPESQGPPATPSAGTPLSWPVGRATVVEAKLGSAMHWGHDGSAMLVPTYELVDDEGAVWTVVAVADEHLDMAER